MERLVLSVWIALTAALLAGCDAKPVAATPPAFPRLPVPAGHSLSQSRIELGERLFHDKQISLEGPLPCSHCQVTCP